MTKLRARLAKFRTSHKASLQNHWQQQAFDLWQLTSHFCVFTDRPTASARTR